VSGLDIPGTTGRDGSISANFCAILSVFISMLIFIFYMHLKDLHNTIQIHRQYAMSRSEEHTSELQSRFDLVCRLRLEKKNDRKEYFAYEKPEATSSTCVIRIIAHESIPFSYEKRTGYSWPISINCITQHQYESLVTST